MNHEYYRFSFTRSKRKGYGSLRKHANLDGGSLRFTIFNRCYALVVFLVPWWLRGKVNIQKLNHRGTKFSLIKNK